MRIIVRVYNNVRLVFSFIGPAFVLIGLYSIYSPEAVSTFRGGKELHGDEELQASIAFIVIGVLVTFVRFYFMKYRKVGQFKNQVQLPRE